MAKNLTFFFARTEVGIYSDSYQIPTIPAHSTWIPSFPHGLTGNGWKRVKYCTTVAPYHAVTIFCQFSAAGKENFLYIAHVCQMILAPEEIDHDDCDISAILEGL